MGWSVGASHRSHFGIPLSLFVRLFTPRKASNPEGLLTDRRMSD
jgi:hypothetical protein